MAITLSKLLQIKQAEPSRGKYRTSASKILGQAELPVPNMQVAILVDSMRGDIDGAEAATSALKSIVAGLTRDSRNRWNFHERVVRALEKANEKIFDQADGAKKIGEIGVSVVVACFTLKDDGVELTIYHIGNCRTYLLREGKVYALTTGHTWGKEIGARGIFLPGRTNAPSLYLGYGPQINSNAQICWTETQINSSSQAQLLPLIPNDAVLICTTALSDTHVQSVVKTANFTADAFVKSATQARDSTQPPTLQLESPEQTDIMALLAERRVVTNLRFGVWQAVVAILSILLLVGLLILGWNWIKTIETTAPTVTLTPMASSTPTATAQPTTTLTPTPSSTATANATPTPSLTATFTPATSAGILTTLVPPTSTPLPTDTPIATPTFTPTLFQEETAPPQLTTTSTPSPENTLTTQTPVSTSIPLKVTLFEPERVQGNKWKFRWQTGYVLQPGEAFELIFWKENQVPLQDGLGWGNISSNQEASVQFDDPSIEAISGSTYFWGVRIVKGNERLYLLQSQRTFTYNRVDNGTKDKDCKGLCF